MSDARTMEMDRMMDLLATRATQGLTQSEARELDDLLRKYPDEDAGQFDLAAAALASVFVAGESREALPPGLRERLLSSADEMAGQSRGVGATLTIGPAASRSTWRPTWRSNLGWLAAAACLALAVVAWWPKAPAGPRRLDGSTLVAFKQEHPDAISVPWGDFNAIDTGEAPEVRNVKGEVVWSDRAQSGYMRFSGLPANDPKRECYQLWIIDEERGLGQRVSGAVFDMNAAGEGIVEIHPQVPIAKAQLFAITIERPGGVVVSDMKRRASLAARGE